MSRAYLTRALEFSAGHRYRRAEWSDEENAVRFGPSAASHGHNYRCEVTVEGEVDPVTGMVVDLAVLDRALRREVTDRMDHIFLNDLPDFSGDCSIPTTENIARVVWRRLEPALPAGCTLVKVCVREDHDLWAEYRGTRLSAG